MYTCLIRKIKNENKVMSHSDILFLVQITEVYSKEIKGAISAVASLQGHLLLASGPKITLYKWTGTELNGVAFYDAPPLHAVSMNIVSEIM